MKSLTTSETASQRVAANVRAELAARRITYTEFADTLGWSMGATSRRLNGQVSWPVDALEEVANALGIPASTLTAERAA